MCFVIRVGTGKLEQEMVQSRSEWCRYTLVLHVEGERKHVPHPTSQESPRPSATLHFSSVEQSCAQGRD